MRDPPIHPPTPPSAFAAAVRAQGDPKSASRTHDLLALTVKQPFSLSPGISVISHTGPDVGGKDSDRLFDERKVAKMTAPPSTSRSSRYASERYLRLIQCSRARQPGSTLSIQHCLMN